MAIFTITKEIARQIMKKPSLKKTKMEVEVRSAWNGSCIHSQKPTQCWSSLRLLPIQGELLDSKSIQNFFIQQPANICKTTLTIDAALQNRFCHYARLLRPFWPPHHLPYLLGFQSSASIDSLHTRKFTSLRHVQIQKRDKTHSSSPAITPASHIKAPRLHQYGTVYRSHSSVTTSAEPS
jgi:hypothetical protein